MMDAENLYATLSKCKYIFRVSTSQEYLPLKLLAPHNIHNMPQSLFVLDRCDMICYRSVVDIIAEV